MKCEIPTDSFAVVYNPYHRSSLFPASALLLASVSCRPQTSFPQQPPASAQQGGQDLGTGISELADGARSTAFLIEVTPSYLEAGDCNSCVQEGGSAGADILSQFGTLFGKSPVTILGS